jgi:hypothetical protein
MSTAPFQVTGRDATPNRNGLSGELRMLGRSGNASIQGPDGGLGERPCADEPWGSGRRPPLNTRNTYAIRKRVRARLVAGQGGWAVQGGKACASRPCYGLVAIRDARS